MEKPMYVILTLHPSLRFHNLWFENGDVSVFDVKKRMKEYFDTISDKQERKSEFGCTELEMNQMVVTMVTGIMLDDDHKIIRDEISEEGNSVRLNLRIKASKKNEEGDETTKGENVTTGFDTSSCDFEFSDGGGTEEKKLNLDWSGTDGFWNNDDFGFEDTSDAFSIPQKKENEEEPEQQKKENFFMDFNFDQPDLNQDFSQPFPNDSGDPRRMNYLTRPDGNTNMTLDFDSNTFQGEPQTEEYFNNTEEEYTFGTDENSTRYRYTEKRQPSKDEFCDFLEPVENFRDTPLVGILKKRSEDSSFVIGPENSVSDVDVSIGEEVGPGKKLLSIGADDLSYHHGLIAVGYKHGVYILRLFEFHYLFFYGNEGEGAFTRGNRVITKERQAYSLKEISSQKPKIILPEPLELKFVGGREIWINQYGRLLTVRNSDGFFLFLIEDRLTETDLQMVDINVEKTYDDDDDESKERAPFQKVELVGKIRGEFVQAEVSNRGYVGLLDKRNHKLLVSRNGIECQFIEYGVLESKDCVMPDGRPGEIIEVVKTTFPKLQFSLFGVTSSDVNRMNYEKNNVITLEFQEVLGKIRTRKSNNNYNRITCFSFSEIGSRVMVGTFRGEIYICNLKKIQVNTVFLPTLPQPRSRVVQIDWFSKKSVSLIFPGGGGRAPLSHNGEMMSPEKSLVPGILEFEKNRGTFNYSSKLKIFENIQYHPKNQQDKHYVSFYEKVNLIDFDHNNNNKEKEQEQQELEHYQDPYNNMYFYSKYTPGWNSFLLFSDVSECVKSFEEYDDGWFHTKGEYRKEVLYDLEFTNLLDDGNKKNKSICGIDIDYSLRIPLGSKPIVPFLIVYDTMGKIQMRRLDNLDENEVQRPYETRMIHYYSMEERKVYQNQWRRVFRAQEGVIKCTDGGFRKKWYDEILWRMRNGDCVHVENWNYGNEGDVDLRERIMFLLSLLNDDDDDDDDEQKKCDWFVEMRVVRNNLEFKNMFKSFFCL